MALIWGDIAESNYENYIHIFYEKNMNYHLLESHLSIFIDWKQDLPNGWTYSYLNSHVSNNYIIPASKNVYNAIINLKKGQKVLMQGYLVGSTWSRKGMFGNDITKRSSLSRDDSNSNSCEDFYVKKLRIEDKIYQ